MKSKIPFTKKDIIVGFGCVLFVLVNLAAISPGGRRRSKETLCLSNLRQWGAIWKMFVDDNNGYLLEDLDWIGPLKPYYRNCPKLLLCPAAARVDPSRASQDFIRGGKFAAWQISDNSNFLLGSYGINQWCNGSNDVDGLSSERLWRTPYVKGTDEVPLFTDAAVPGFAPLHWDQPPEWDGQIYWSGEKPGSVQDLDEMRSCCLNRHNGGINGLFLDFSARKIGLKELWELQWNRRWFIGWHGFPDPYPPWQFKDPQHWMYKFRNYK